MLFLVFNELVEAELDVTPIIASARLAAGGAIDTLATYRASRWRERVASRRRLLAPGTGIV